MRLMCRLASAVIQVSYWIVMLKKWGLKPEGSSWIHPLVFVSASGTTGENETKRQEGVSSALWPGSNIKKEKNYLSFVLKGSSGECPGHAVGLLPANQTPG